MQWCIIIGYMRSGIERLKPREIASSTRVPVELIRKYVPPYSVLLDVGPGRANYWGEIKRTVGDVVIMGLELNPLAVALINNQDWPWFAYEGDVTVLGDGLEDGAIAGEVEFYHGILAQALFPSLVEKGAWKRALEVIDVMMRPGGHLLVSDFPRADRRSSYIELLRRGLVTEDLVETNIAWWQWRYEQNGLVFPDLEELSFVVAKPSENKELEWGTAKELKRLGESDDFERFARHMDVDEWSEFLRGRLQYELMERQWTVWLSRGGGWYPGFIDVWQKSKVYRYHPWKQGLREDDPELWDKYKARKGSPDRRDCWEEWFRRLFEGLDRWGVGHGRLDEILRETPLK